MQELFENPFPGGDDRLFWDMCVQRDIEAFLAADWTITGPDFDQDEFLGIDAGGSANPEDWQPKYPTLQSYKQEFDRQAADFATLEFAADPRTALYSALTLSKARVVEDRATILKTFDGEIPLADGSSQILSWKSLFHLRQKNNIWRFTGFVGYLPL